MQTAEMSTEASNVFVQKYRALLQFFGVKNVTNATYVVRKAAHIFEFYVQSLCFSLFFVFGEERFHKRIIYTLFAGLLIACCDEFIQLFSEGRASQIQDVFIDFSGAAAGTLTALGVYYRRNRRNIRHE